MLSNKSSKMKTDKKFFARSMTNTLLLRMTASMISLEQMTVEATTLIRMTWRSSPHEALSWLSRSKSPMVALAKDQRKKPSNHSETKTFSTLTYNR